MNTIKSNEKALTFWNTALQCLRLTDKDKNLNQEILISDKKKLINNYLAGQKKYKKNFEKIKKIIASKKTTNFIGKLRDEISR